MAFMSSLNFIDRLTSLPLLPSRRKSSDGDLPNSSTARTVT
jgi:hypothetical protein